MNDAPPPVPDVSASMAPQTGTRWHTRRWLGPLVAGVLLVGACGGSSEGSSPDGSAGAGGGTGATGGGTGATGGATGGTGGSAETGGSGGTGGTSNTCVDDGDPCEPGEPLEPCVIGFDCCLNVCECTAGTVACHTECDASLGSGAACGGQDAGDDASETCPSDFFDADGTPCREEGKLCSSGCTDPCQFCNLLRCESGTWTWMEAFPDPNCNDAGADAAVDGGQGDASAGAGRGDAGDDARDGAGDAGTDGAGRGDGGLGTTCAIDDECVVGLRCCYPCGVAGCTNQCMQPLGNGQCPAFP